MALMKKTHSEEGEKLQVNMRDVFQGVQIQDFFMAVVFVCEK